MARFWIAVASREHVMRGVTGGFAQVCHGKSDPLKRMSNDDYIIYYSPVETFGGKDICRKFTALGRITEETPYQVQMYEDFVPWRRNVKFRKIKEVAIEPLLDRLSFIRNKKQWGFPFRRGCFEIPDSDFRLIASEMGVSFED